MSENSDQKIGWRCACGWMVAADDLQDPDPPNLDSNQHTTSERCGAPDRAMASERITVDANAIGRWATWSTTGEVTTYPVEGRRQEEVSPARDLLKARRYDGHRRGVPNIMVDGEITGFLYRLDEEEPAGVARLCERLNLFYLRYDDERLTGRVRDLNDGTGFAHLTGRTGTIEVMQGHGVAVITWEKYPQTP